MVKTPQVSILIQDFKIKNISAIEVNIKCMYLWQQNVL